MTRDPAQRIWRKDTRRMEASPEVLRRIAALSPQQQTELLRRLGARQPAAAAQPEAIRRRPGPRAPLCFAQQRLWFLDQLEPGTPQYNIASAAPIRSRIDASVLQRSLTEVIQRHEALRTTFELDEDDSPAQIIHPRIDVPLEVADLQDLGGPAREAQLTERVTELAARPFDLATGPLVRAGLIRLAPDDHVFIITTHHIISDVWSIEIMLRDLAVTYQALLHGQAVPLADPPLQYADFAHWQREWLQGEVLERQVGYWREQLSGDLPVLDLPADRPRPAQQSFRGANHRHQLSAELSRRLDQLSAEAKTTPFTLFLTVLAVLLHRYCGQDDICVGAPVSNRTRAELEGMVGYLGNTLVLRTDLSGDPEFRDALRRAHAMVMDAFANQDLPFEKVAGAAQPKRDLSRMPLLQVMFVFRMISETSDESVELPGFGDALPIDNGTTKFDLTFAVERHAGTYRLTVEYSTDLFDAATIDRMVRHWETLLAGAAADPGTPIGLLPLLAPAERRQLLIDWNATQRPFPEERCLHELFEEQVAQRPDAIAVTSRDGDLSYGELAERANRVAHQLRRLGAGPDVPVAVCLEKSADVAVGLLGILKAGSAYLPLDTTAPAAHVSRLLANARAPVLLTHGRLAERLGLGPADGGHPVLIDHDWPVIQAQPGTPPPVPVTSGNLAYVIYTSGSTGQPKGVMLDHRGRVNNFHDFNDRFGIGPGDSVLALASLSFDMSAYDVLGTLMTGARIVFPDPGSERDPAHWLTLLRRERVTVWHSVPALLEMLVAYAEDDDLARLADLRLILLGGDWIPTTLPGRIRELAPDARVISLGGATEVSMDSTIYEVKDVDPEAPSIPYGKPMANQRCYVLDPRLQPVPAGVAGELYLAGVGVGRGYLGDPALTATKFLDSPLSEEPGRIYRTGDRAKYRQDGNLELLGRADFQIKIRGWRIEPGEIQNMLRQHPSVKEAIVVAHTDPPGARQLVAYLLGHEELAPAELQAWARERIPGYMVPATFVQLDRFPLTANGKVDRRGLPPPPPAQDTGTTYAGPRTEAERILAELWQELLGAERVGIDDNFFSLGGDSIQAIQTIARARKRGILLAPKQLFQCQTIRELAALTVPSDPATGETAVRFDAPLLRPQLLDRLRADCPGLRDAYPLSPMQQVMLQDSVERPVPGLYVIQADYLFTPGGIDVELLGQAWQMVIDRHPVLRTSFAWAGLDEPVQIVHAHAELPIEHHDLRGLDIDSQLRRQDELVAEDRRRGFDLTQAPLVRLHLLRLGDNAYKYISSNHHIILDGWSRAIVQQEVFAAYEALRSGRGPASLPDARPFRDYVAWVRAKPVTDAHDQWRRYLSQFAEPTPIVAARGKPDATCRGPFAKQSSPLPPATAADLGRFTKAWQVTANTVIQGAWLVLLGRYTGQRDVVLGVMSSGRATELLDIDTVVGVCINALPVRTKLDPGEPLLPWLRRLQQEQASLRELEHTPIAAIERWQGTGGPLFESMMVFENYPWDGSLLALADRIDFTHPLAQPDYQLAQFALPLRVEVEPRTPLLIMHYYQDSFTDEAVTAMIADWAATIERMLGDPQQPLAGLLGG
jgi:amino acid adenylation domain-containing protein